MNKYKRGYELIIAFPLKEILKTKKLYIFVQRAI